MSERKAVVTIDGPSGAGKSTISKMLAARLNFTYLDTGAMYRAVGLKVQRAGLDLDSAAGKAGLSRLLADIDISLAPAAAGMEDTRAFLDGEEVSQLIRTAEMGLVASRVSAEPAVRAKLTEMQRRLGQRGGVVAEGRDTGTVVFPGAEFKFYLDASPAERARRRCEQLQAKGLPAEPADILAQINKRDQDDSSRALAPLKPAADAVVVDCSDMGIQEVVEFMAARILASCSPALSPTGS